MPVTSERKHRRVAGGFLALVLGLSACSSGVELRASEGADATATAETPEPSTVITETPTPIPVPDATPEPTPEAVEPVATATPEPQGDDCTFTPSTIEGDFDGDGIPDAAIITDVEGEQVLRWCLSTGQLDTLPLPMGVWYLSAFDIEGDGTDELMFGIQDVGDRPGAPAFEVQVGGVDQSNEMQFLLRSGDDAPYVVVGGYDDPTYSARSGVACVDLDEDGLRELVSVSASLTSEANGVWEWTRTELVLSQSGATEGAIDSGELTEGEDNANIDLLGTFSCGDQTPQLTRYLPPSIICEGDMEGVYYQFGDFDGDGIEDMAYTRQRNLGLFTAIGVCTADARDEQAAGGQGLFFEVRDLNQDGVDEVWSGGRAAPAGFWSVGYVINGSRLAPLRSESFGDFAVQEGWVADAVSGDLLAYVGCTDLDDDGVTEMVTLEAVDSAVPNQVSWQARGYQFLDGVVVEVATATGTIEGEIGDNPPAVDDALHNALAELAGFPCVAG